MKHFLLLFAFSFFLFLNNSQGQQPDSIQHIPYYKIPDTPATFTAGGIAARMIDGLGFRFYWATDNLSETDFTFRLGDDARNISETILHIYSMSNMILKSVNPAFVEITGELNNSKIRAQTLKNFQSISLILKASKDEDFKKYNINFNNGNSLGFWYLINGPIEDCLWHCGQIVTIRRQAGNPFNPKVNLMNGKLRDE